MNRCYFVLVQISTPEIVDLGSERNILALFAIAQGKISSSEVSVKLNAEGTVIRSTDSSFTFVAPHYV